MPEEKHDNSSVKVLVAEDDADVCQLIELMLRDMGITEIRRVRDGRAALKEFEYTPDRYNVVISDWNMPEMNGLDLLKAIREIRPEALFMMLTARSDKSAIVEAKNAGVSSYVAKPFTLQELSRKMGRLIEILIERRTQEEDERNVHNI